VTRTIRSERLIGRADELKQFDRALSAAAAGHAATLLVGGDAGVGKTRLLEEWSRRAGDAGARMVIGRCLQLGAASLPFAAVVEALRALVAGTPAGRRREVFGPLQASAALARVVPELGPSDPAGDSVIDVVGGDRQLRMFEQVAALLGHAARRGPVVVAIEDLHWADQSTLDLVSYLVHTLDDDAVVLVLTYRTDDLARRHPLRPLVGRLRRVPSTVQVELPPLDRHELAELAAAILGDLPTTALLDDLHARTEGNPFFAEEMLAATTADDDAATGPVPDALAGLLLARVDRLPDDAQAIVRVAAAAGRDVDHELLTTVAGRRLGLPASRLLQALRDAVAEQVLVVSTDGVGYAFRHALLQEAVHGDLLPGERVQVHAEIARILTERPDLAGPAGATAALAWHYMAAQDQPRALRASVEAARVARAAFAVSDEQHHLERALELWDAVPDAADAAGTSRNDLLIAAAAAAHGAGHQARAERYAQAALDLIDEEAEPTAAALAWMWLADARYAAGHPGAFDAHERAAALIPPEPSAARARVLGSYAAALMLAPRLEEAAGPIEEAVRVAREVGAHGDHMHALLRAGVVRSALGDPDGGLAAFAEARELAARIGSPHVARGMKLTGGGRLYVNESDVLFNLGHTEEALDVCREGLAAARDFGLRRSACTWIHGNLAEFLLHLGRLDEARAHLHGATALHGTDVRDMHLQLRHGHLALLTDDLDAADEALELAARVHHGVATGAQMAGPRHELAAELALARDDPDTALAAVEAGLDNVEQADGVRRYGGWLYALGMRAAALAGGEPGRAAATHVHDRLEASRTTAIHGARPMWRAHTAVADAEWASLHGHDDASGRWHAAIAALDDLAFLPAATSARIRHAESVLPGERAVAEAALARAWHDADDAGLALARRQAEAVARRANIGLGPGGASDTPFGLTPREVEVLRLVAEGRSNPEIGRALYISRKTASTHVSNILAKLGVATRGEASAVAHREGLADS
jgi:DNA-binding CsgD family transcriptional regulator/tetratricopeptide (TPR) repeat protein